MIQTPAIDDVCPHSLSCSFADCNNKDDNTVCDQQLAGNVFGSRGLFATT